MDLVNTTDSHYKGELWLILYVVVTVLLRITLQTELISLCLAILGNVLLGSLEDSSTLLLVLLKKDNDGTKLTRHHLAMKAC